MEIGLALPNIGPFATREAMLAIIDRAEELGLDSIWTGDHLAFPYAPRFPYPYSRGKPRPYAADTPVLDPLVIMAAAVGRTKRLRIGVSVLILPYRHPLVTAKMIASMDELSGGRIILGVGVGWLAEEFDTLGVAYEKRGALTDEQIRYFREVWYQERPEFHGRFYEFSDMTFLPKPSHTIPIWIGGNTRPAMRRAARLGDGINLIDLTPRELERLLGEFRQVCAQVERPMEDVALSIRSTFKVSEAPLPESERTMPLVGDLEQITQDLRAFKDMGVGHMILDPRAVGGNVDLFLRSMEVIARDLKPAIG